jgi:hypothetical protein
MLIKLAGLGLPSLDKTRAEFRTVGEDLFKERKVVVQDLVEAVRLSSRLVPGPVGVDPMAHMRGGYGLDAGLHMSQTQQDKTELGVGCGGRVGDPALARLHPDKRALEQRLLVLGELPGASCRGRLQGGKLVEGILVWLHGAHFCARSHFYATQL